VNLVDANLLIYAHDSTSPFHTKAAAFAIEQNAELLTADGGFSRFTGLRFSNPLEPAQWVHENKSTYRY
jgi:hypothetical protein